MALLRERRRLINPRSPSIHQWVGEYSNGRVLCGREITILTQWCISKNLERRLKIQGGTFVPTKLEQRLFVEDIPNILGVAKSLGINISWFLTLNRPYLSSWMASLPVEAAYEAMIGALAAPIDNLVSLNWERDILGGARPVPNKEVLARFDLFVDADALSVRVAWTEKRSTVADWTVGKGIEPDTRYKIACEAEEGRLLSSPDGPFGDEFLLAPVETPEQYDYFSLLVPDFKKRIIPVLPLYPWRT